MRPLTFAVCGSLSLSLELATFCDFLFPIPYGPILMSTLPPSLSLSFSHNLYETESFVALLVSLISLHNWPLTLSLFLFGGLVSGRRTGNWESERKVRPAIAIYHKEAKNEIVPRDGTHQKNKKNFIYDVIWDCTKNCQKRDRKANFCGLLNSQEF